MLTEKPFWPELSHLANIGGAGGQTERRKYRFDSVFTPSSTQEDVFADAKRLVQTAMDGCNVCVFAYVERTFKSCIVFIVYMFNMFNAAGSGECGSVVIDFIKS